MSSMLACCLCVTKTTCMMRWQVCWMRLPKLTSIASTALCLHDQWRVLYWHASFGPHGPHARWPAARLAIVQHWGWLIIWAAVLLAVMSPRTGILGSWKYRAGHGPPAALRDSCAAALGALQATHRWLRGMILAGAVQLITCYALFTYWHSLPAESGVNVNRLVATRALILGSLSTLGKNLLYPVLPALLLSEAVFTYRCISPRLGLVDIVLSSVISCAWVVMVVGIEFAAAPQPFGDAT